jgi:hypothetical protein
MLISAGRPHILKLFVMPLNALPIVLVLLLPLAAVSADKHPKRPPVASSDKVRVFVGESESFFSSSFGAASANATSAAATHGSAAGIEKMTVLVMKTLNDKCPTVIVVDRPEKADYFLRLDRNGILIRTNAMAVFNKGGEMIFVGTGVRLAKQVKLFCDGLPYAQTVPPQTAPAH